MILTSDVRTQAIAYRDMIRRAKRRAKAGRSVLKTQTRSRQLDRSHKNAIAQLFCLATWVRFGVERYGVQVAHVRFSNAGRGAFNPGLQRKPDDRWTVPLSPEEHRLQHSMGEAAYWRELGLDPHVIAEALRRSTPDHQDMLAALRSTRSKLIAANAYAGLSQ